MDYGLTFWVTAAFLVLEGYSIDGLESEQFNLVEAEQMALELSGELLPSTEAAQDVSKMITLDLQKIRESYGSSIKNVEHQRSWVPGELLSTRISSEQLRNVNESDFGPFTKVEVIDLSPLYVVTAMSFGKPYNPITLAKRLHQQFGFGSSPNTVYYDGDDIDVTYPSKENKTILRYLIKRGSGSEEDCNEGSDNCSRKHYWVFSASGIYPDRTVELIKEYTDDSKNKNLYAIYE